MLEVAPHGWIRIRCCAAGRVAGACCSASGGSQVCGRLVGWPRVRVVGRGAPTEPLGALLRRTPTRGWWALVFVAQGRARCRPWRVLASFAVCCVMSGLGSAPATQGAPLRPKQRPSCRLARLAARATERMRMVLSRVRAVRGPTHACLRVLYTCSADHTIARTYRYGSYAHVGALWLCL